MTEAGTGDVEGTCAECGRKAPLVKHKKFDVCKACEEQLWVFSQVASTKR